MKYDYYRIKSFILIGWWNMNAIQSAVTFSLDFLFLYFQKEAARKKSRQNASVIEEQDIRDDL